MSPPTASMISTVMCHCCLEESEEPSLLEVVEEAVQMTGFVPSTKIKREEVRTLSLQYMLVYTYAYIRTPVFLSILYCILPDVYVLHAVLTLYLYACCRSK